MAAPDRKQYVGAQSDVYTFAAVCPGVLDFPADGDPLVTMYSS